MVLKTISFFVVLFLPRLTSTTDIAVSNRLSARLCQNLGQTKLGRVMPGSSGPQLVCPVIEKEGGMWKFINCGGGEGGGGGDGGMGGSGSDDMGGSVSSSGGGSDKGSRIINGQQAPKHSHRYLIYVRFKDEIKGFSGTILNRYSIMINAYQLQDLLPKAGNVTENLRIYIGKYEHAKRENEEQIRFACGWTNHPQFNTDPSKTAWYPYAMLHLYDPLTFNQFVDSVKFANESQRNSLSSPCLVPGWGNPKPVAEIIQADFIQEANATFGECIAHTPVHVHEQCSNPVYCWGDTGSPAICTQRHRIYASALAGAVDQKTNLPCQNSVETIWEDVKHPSVADWISKANEEGATRCRLPARFELY